MLIMIDLFHDWKPYVRCNLQPRNMTARNPSMIILLGLTLALYSASLIYYTFRSISNLMVLGTEPASSLILKV